MGYLLIPCSLTESQAGTLRTADRLLIISLLLLAVYAVVTSIVPGMSDILLAAYDLMLTVATTMGYLGAFLVALIGNATVLVPFPYIGAAFILGGLTDEVTHVFLFNPILVGLVSGLGATIGEMTGYAVGYAGGNMIDEEHRNGFRIFVDEHPRSIPLVLWFLAVTPLPDDVLVVPLGASRYPWWKVVIPEFVGKSMFLGVIAWAGQYGLEIVKTLIGGTDPTSMVSRGIEILTMALLILAVYFLATIDWGRLTRAGEHQEIP
ncbi:MAG: VTT domain-containing protein [Candidatus Thorarchaeota archaeon]